MSSQRAIIVGQRISPMPSGWIESVRSPTWDEVLMYIVYWDKIDLPIVNEIAGDFGEKNADLDVLEREGIVSRSTVTYHFCGPAIISMEYYAELQLCAQFDVLRAREELRANGTVDAPVWSIGQTTITEATNLSFPAQGRQPTGWDIQLDADSSSGDRDTYSTERWGIHEVSEARYSEIDKALGQRLQSLGTRRHKASPKLSGGFNTLVVTLRDMLPVPNADTPLDKVLELKGRREPELHRFRAAIEDLYNSSLGGGATEFMRARDKVSSALGELDRVINEAKIKRAIRSLDAFLFLPSSAATGIAAQLSGVSPLVGTAFGLGAGAAVTVTKRLLNPPNPIPADLQDFAYLYHLKKQN